MSDCGDLLPGWAVFMALTFLGGAIVGASAVFREKDAAQQAAINKDLRERCCSCTQAELGRCGR